VQIHVHRDDTAFPLNYKIFTEGVSTKTGAVSPYGISFTVDPSFRGW